MLVITDYSKVAAASAEIIEAGYGYSTLSETYEKYQSEEFIEMLRDWGWCGPEEDRPVWCAPI